MQPQWVGFTMVCVYPFSKAGHCSRVYFIIIHCTGRVQSCRALELLILSLMVSTPTDDGALLIIVIYSLNVYIIINK